MTPIGIYKLPLLKTLATNPAKEPKSTAITRICELAKPTKFMSNFSKAKVVAFPEVKPRELKCNVIKGIIKAGVIIFSPIKVNIINRLLTCNVKPNPRSFLGPIFFN
jgi:hypothetical protein